MAAGATQRLPTPLSCGASGNEADGERKTDREKERKNVTVCLYECLSLYLDAFRIKEVQQQEACECVTARQEVVFSSARWLSHSLVSAGWLEPKHPYLFIHTQRGEWSLNGSR